MRTLFQFKRSQFDLVKCNLALFQFILLQFKLMGNWLKFLLSCTEANSCSDVRCSCSPAAHPVPLPDITVPRNSAKLSPCPSPRECSWHPGVLIKTHLHAFSLFNLLKEQQPSGKGHNRVWALSHLKMIFCCLPLTVSHPTQETSVKLSFHWHGISTSHSYVSESF